MFDYKTLVDSDIKVLHKAFVDAFSDYQVKIDLPVWKLEGMLKRRGYSPEISMGAFLNGDLVGFILNGFRNWNGKLTVYDTGTGVIPEHRKKGITSSIFSKVMELLAEKNAEQYLLEVIKTNKAAYELYRKQGFAVTRTFLCFRMDKDKYELKGNFETEHIEKIDDALWKQLMEFWDINPSWQNSIDSVNSVPESFMYSVVRIDNKIVGYGIIERKTGDIPQIAVNKSYRHMGIERSLISDLIKNTQSSSITVINIDDKSIETKEFLKRLGFEHFVDQYEMILKIK